MKSAQPAFAIRKPRVLPRTSAGKPANSSADSGRGPAHGNGIRISKLLAPALLLLLMTAIHAGFRIKPKVEAHPLAGPDASRVEARAHHKMISSSAPEESRPLDLEAPGISGLEPQNADPVAQLLNEALPLKTRRQAARTLARNGQALFALQSVLRDGPPYLKAAIGEGLGESPLPEAQALLIEMIGGPDETAARGAIRGLGPRGDTEAANLLSQLLFDDQKSPTIRTEAALALGTVHQPEAVAALVHAVSEIQDSDIRASALEGLAGQPFEQTARFFEELLQSTDVPVISKVSALEALGKADSNAARLLLRYASDSAPEVRAAAAWALSINEGASEFAPQLGNLIKQEQSEEVRNHRVQAFGKPGKLGRSVEASER